MQEGEKRLNVGGAFIILIIIVIALAGFALLSVRSSENEYRLAKKSADAVKEYYSMDSKATLIMARICEIVEDSGNAGLTEEDIGKTGNISTIELNGGVLGSVEYEIKSGRKILSVKLDFEGTEVSVEKWRMSTETADDEYTIELSD